MDIQLCIVSGQPLANLIPVLQFRPERVALVVSTAMKDAADQFVGTLKSVGWTEQYIDRFEELPSENYGRLVDFAMEVHEKLTTTYPDVRIVYNATGGNKLMALAFSQWFGSGDQHDMIYSDTANRRIEHLVAGRESSEPMASVLDLGVYLTAQNKTVRSRQDTDEKWLEKAQLRKAATRFLAENAEKVGGLVALFNKWYAPDNQGSAAPNVLRLEHPPRGDWRKALELLEQGQVLEQGDSAQEWFPRSSDAAVYLSGAWLEEFVWHTAKDAGAGDVGLSVTVTDNADTKHDIRNEMDVVVVHNNRLLMIECKTGNLARDRKDEDIIYKLDSLTDQAGGLFGAGALVSFRPLDYSNKKGRKVNVRARAGSVSLLTCEAGELSDLKILLRNWVALGEWVNTP